MLVCMDCKRVASEKGGACLCGSEAQAVIQEDGAAVAFYGPHGVLCQRCGTSTSDIAFRRYRRVVGLAFFDKISTLTGYFCEDCRRRLFREYQGRTLRLGWWGLLAMTFRNPYAIGVNFKALRGPPSKAAKYGAITLHEQETAEALAAGEVADAWRCRTCGLLFIGREDALKHADAGHPEMYLEDAQAAVVRISDP
jgi:hypothetical protein